MTMMHTYASTEPTRAEIDSREGPLLLEFGAAWCGICKAAQPDIAKALEAHPSLAHIKVADGKGLPLGRSFRVKLWPTLVALRDGKEIGRVVRPRDHREVAALLESLSA